jgi:Fe-S-cluster containining protein
MTGREAERIRSVLGVSRAWFRRRYVRCVGADRWEARLEDDGACPFLADERHCTVYGERPEQCRSYPFWPEIVASRTTWEREGRRCEGIGRGEVTAVATIERRLRRAGWKG